MQIISIAGTAITFFYCRNKYEIDLINSIFFIKKGKVVRNEIRNNQKGIYEVK